MPRKPDEQDPTRPEEPGGRSSQPSSPGASAQSGSSSSSAQPSGPASGQAGTSSSTAGGREAEPPRAGAGDGQAGADRSPRARRQQYMVATRTAPGLQTMDINLLADQFADSAEIEVVKKITPRGLVGLQAAGLPGAQTILVARMAPDRAEALRRNAGPQLIVEVDHRLGFGDATLSLIPQFRDPAVMVPLQDAFTATVEVFGEQGPVAGADVYLFGSTFPAQAKTDDKGQARLTLYSETADTLRGLVVKPQAGYWNHWIERPQLRADAVNRIDVRALSATFDGFPDKQLVGWGLKAMRVDQLPSTYRGQGVRIAIIDSGAAAASHRDLTQIRHGVDVVRSDPDSWREDDIGHGSHCAGIIGGFNRDGFGIRGVAPEAEIYVYKIFPTASFSDLVVALDLCMQNDIDVINMSIGVDQASEIVEQRLARAKAQGIACVAASGNSAGAVLYPASSPNVLAVGAVGRWGEFPDDSYHAAQSPDPTRRDGYFAAKFACSGPEVRIAGPGVAVVSSVPANDFAAWDGTSMAAPHITGLAALLLAHHEDFRTALSARNGTRVDQLFRILQETAQPLGIADRGRIGAGLPDAVRALQYRVGTGAPTAGFGLSPEQQAQIAQLIAEEIQRSIARVQPRMAQASAGPLQGLAPQYGNVAPTLPMAAFGAQPTEAPVVAQIVQLLRQLGLT